MGIIVPPAPQKAEAAEVMERLERFRAKDHTRPDEQPRKKTSMILILAVFLSFAGISMDIFALLIICAPESQLACLVISACTGLA
jgi:hypothetical protein